MLAVIITVVVSLALSAFFSGMEIAFLSSNKLKLEIEKKQSRAFGYVAGLFSKYPGQYITTILVGNNLALVIYSLQMSVLIQLLLVRSGLMLYGISFLYGTTGTLYFGDMAARIDGSPLQVMALVFFLSGLGFKISLVPFHLWTADAYQGAPTNVTAYLSVVSKGAAAFVLLTVLVKVFAPMTEQWQTLLWIVTVSSITVANLFAIRQKDLKRFMAFSSISQAGYIMLAVIGGSAIGMTSLVFYVLVYMAANLAVFGVLSAVEQHSGGRVSLEDYNGFSRTNPRLALLMTLALFSLAGIPPFAGFFSKFFVFAAAFSGGFHLLVFIALVNTVVSLYYYLLIVKAMYIMPGDAPIAAFRSDRYTRVSLALCMAGVLLLGIVSAVYDGINAFAFGL